MPIQGKAKSNISHLIPCKGAQLFPGEAAVHSVSVERFMLTAERARKHAIPPPHSSTQTHAHALMYLIACVHASTCMHTYTRPIMCVNKNRHCVFPCTHVCMCSHECVH